MDGLDKDSTSTLELLAQAARQYEQYLEVAKLGRHPGNRWEETAETGYQISSDLVPLIQTKPVSGIQLG